MRSADKISVTILDLFNLYQQGMSDFMKAAKKEHGIKIGPVDAAPLNQKFKQYIIKLKK
jgi:hypothetical protein